MKNKLILSAGILNLFSAILHLTGGQITLVNPLFKSDLNAQVQAEWLGCWHMITIILFYTSFVLLKNGQDKLPALQSDLLKFLAWLYILFGIPSLCASIFFGVLAAQFVLLIPIGILILSGINKGSNPE